MSQPPPLPPRPASREPPASAGTSSATRPAATMRDGGTPIAVCVRVRPLNEYESQHGGGGDNVWTVREESNALAYRPAADAPGTTYSFEKARGPAPYAQPAKATPSVSAWASAFARHAHESASRVRPRSAGGAVLTLTERHICGVR